MSEVCDELVWRNQEFMAGVVADDVKHFLVGEDSRVALPTRFNFAPLAGCRVLFSHRALTCHQTGTDGSNNFSDPFDTAAAVSRRPWP